MSAIKSNCGRLVTLCVTARAPRHATGPHSCRGVLFVVYAAVECKSVMANVVNNSFPTTSAGVEAGISVPRLFPKITLVGTLDIIHEASTALRWAEAELTEVALALRWRGNFAPPRRDVRCDWYNGLLTRAGIGEP